MDGSLLGTFGRQGRGDAGELRVPRAAATDPDDNLLVCDSYNNRLQVMTRDGKWHIVLTDKKIETPRDAVVDDDNVYILCSAIGKAQTIYHFEIT